MREKRVRFDEPSSAPASATGAVEMGCTPTKREEGARVRGEIDQLKNDEKKGKQPGNGTQEPKKKTAREWDPRTREQTEPGDETQGPLKTKSIPNRKEVTCESDAKLDTKARATFEGQSSDRIAKSDVVKDTMSATVKLAKEIDEPDIGQPTAECHLMAWP